MSRRFQATPTASASGEVSAAPTFEPRLRPFSTRGLRFLSLVLLVPLAISGARAAELKATGISIPFFNATGTLTHRMLAKSAVKSGPRQNLHGVEIHYFAPGDPKVIVQKIEAADATWDDKKEVLAGQGSIVVATVENRLTGDGFEFELATSLLQIHRDFTMTNPDVRLTSDRASIELIVEQSDDRVKVRDVKRCEAIGNLHIVVEPAAQPRYHIREAFSDLAIYDGTMGIISLPHATRTLQAGGGEGRFETLTLNLRDEAKKEARPPESGTGPRLDP
jgi:hypothetical protein